MMMQTITDYDIQAYIDDELDHEHAKKVQGYLDYNPNAKARYKELMIQKKILKIWWTQKLTH